ncbi:hypothetical protein [Myxococcus sp. RHSTA-1-4]|uniref:hypothetical protein n=1 Tax=Myxococcus sp. RHSTA-1-4 TaxID=2874601 RepID=UPI001CBD680D|nr:hypothetical protein [Myxococcus sp. RHSTA-1-4]MBZ4416107.1 hypothetical protein [Myxococcus sp. RHSTA-1-4]
MNARLFLVMSVWICAACGAGRNNTRDVAGDYSLSERPGSGLIVVSTRLTTDCEQGETPPVAFHYEDDSYAHKRTGVIPVNDPFRKHDLQEPPGYLSIREVHAGAHRIDQLPPLATQLYAPFEVEAGKVVYLGELHVRVSNCGSPPAKVAVQVTDQWERDGELFHQRMKNLRSEDVVKRLLTEFTLERTQTRHH